MNNLISLKKISKNYILNNKVKALRNFNFDFELGKIYSIVGPSGSGKSTLLNILSLIDKPTSGNIKIDGKLIDFNNNDLNDKIRASSIGIIYQNYNLLPDFTALENVSLAGLALNKNNKTSLNEARKIISSLGLSKRLDHFP